ncbi:MAG: hypothetical protein M3R15_33065 [Acidobacteriota bacterium]|nr:hypothetical protein [Acidobacteriota bacterium]
MRFQIAAVLDLCHDWLRTWPEINIWPDMDESGARVLCVIVREMHDRELAAKSIRAVHPNGYKDANQMLQRVMNKAAEHASPIYCGVCIKALG